jgi:4-oxalocrotonate tautomerase
MPLISVSLYPGRTQKQKDDFAKAITKSAVDILKTKENHVIVIFDETPKENWFMAGNQL